MIIQSSSFFHVKGQELKPTNLNMTQGQRTQLDTLLTAAYHDYERGLRSYAFFKTNDSTASEDLVAETFAKTWQYLVVGGGKIEKVKAFLYHVLNNLIVDKYRKRKTVSLDALREDGFEPSIEDSDGSYSNLEGKSALSLTKQLPQKYRQIIRLRYMKSLSLEEMSIVTGQSKNTLAVQVHRGLKRLKLVYNHPQAKKSMVRI